MPAPVAGDAPSVTFALRRSQSDQQGAVLPVVPAHRNARGGGLYAHWTADPMRETLWHDCYNHAVANPDNTVHNETLSAYHFHRIRGPGHRDVETPTNLASRSSRHSVPTRRSLATNSKSSARGRPHRPSPPGVRCRRSATATNTRRLLSGSRRKVSRRRAERAMRASAPRTI